MMYYGIGGFQSCTGIVEKIQSNKKIEGYTVICGHTPTLTLGSDSILHREGAILIDCGCVYDGGKLVCLRLDDMKAFYF